MAKTIHLLHAPDTILEIFQTKFGETWNFSLIKSVESIVDWSEVERLILFVPVMVNHQYVNSSLVWQQYLSKKKPNLSFVIAGFTAQEHPNYIDLLNLPIDLDLLFEQSLPTTQNWLDLKLEGLNISSILTVFFDGHGEDSIIEAINRVYRGLHFIGIETNRFKEPYEKTWQELYNRGGLQMHWMTLKHRWEYYFPYFSCLPFYTTALAIDELIKKINPYFEVKGKDEALFKNLNCEKNSKIIKQHLIDIRNYVQ